MSYNVLVRSRYGLMLVNRNDQYIGRGFLEYGEFSTGECDLFAEHVKPGHTVIEVGANIGAHTVRLAQLVGPTGRVIAYEPQRILFQTLCANVQLNQLTNVDARLAAVGSQPGTIRVPDLDPNTPMNFGGLNIEGRVRGTDVPLETLDTIERCDFLKLDCEGMERDALLGAKEMIARSRPVIYLENDRSDRSDALIETVKALGYAPEWHTPLLYSPDNFAKNLTNVFGEIASINMLCLPTEAP